MTDPRIIIPSATPVPGFALSPSPEVERLVVQKPDPIPPPPSPREIERDAPAPDDLSHVPLTPRLIVACAAARDLLSRSLNTTVVVNALITMRHTRAEAEAAVRLVLYMKKR